VPAKCRHHGRPAHWKQQLEDLSFEVAEGYVEIGEVYSVVSDQYVEVSEG